MSETPEFIMERVFNAPRDLVWKTWTDSKLLGRWYGPGVDTVIHQLDVKPGGVWLNEMKMQHGSFFERFEYLEVEEPARLVWIQSPSDIDGNLTAPMMENWPQHLKAVITFEADGDKTNMRFVWSPHKASAAECAAFQGAMSGLGKGWGSGMDIIAEILAEIQS